MSQGTVPDSIMSDLMINIGVHESRHESSESRDGYLTHILRVILYEIGGGPGALFCKMHQALRCMSN